VSRKRGATAALAVLAVFGASTFIALALAAPRLITLGSEFFQLSRTPSLHYSGYYELLRFFPEGIYGSTSPKVARSAIPSTFMKACNCSRPLRSRFSSVSAS
jgi:hypothetical protein